MTGIRIFGIILRIPGNLLCNLHERFIWSSPRTKCLEVSYFLKQVSHQLHGQSLGKAPAWILLQLFQPKIFLAVLMVPEARREQVCNSIKSIPVRGLSHLFLVVLMTLLFQPVRPAGNNCCLITLQAFPGGQKGRENHFFRVYKILCDVLGVDVKEDQLQWCSCKQWLEKWHFSLCWDW